MPKAAGELLLCTLPWWPRCSQFLSLCFSLSFPLIPQREIPLHKAEHSRHRRAPWVRAGPRPALRPLYCLLGGKAEGLWPSSRPSS